MQSCASYILLHTRVCHRRNEGGGGGGGSSEFSGGGGGGEGLKSIHGGNMGASSQEKGEYLVSAICTML